MREQTIIKQMATEQAETITKQKQHNKKHRDKKKGIYSLFIQTVTLASNKFY